LRPEIDAINSALAESNAPAPESSSNGSFDPVAVARESARLRSQLEASDGDSEETFRTLKVALAGRVERGRLDALGADIGNFDFDAALSKLDELVKDQSLNSGEILGSQMTNS
jgi:hypothetical protein